jgi:hypothetical protein
VKEKLGLNKAEAASTKALPVEPIRDEE